ncbi:MAG: CDP-diacylglycerol--glycerol-3-phosphate 3-phosphatidyltransferase [Candidatus Sumerlaeales bacterium]|nr:CDP-diacylglycerol--glycerol-3-phosphate 3-phosphatidyltransferase [Candidatus Sumerlaeales bacterium]
MNLANKLTLSRIVAIPFFVGFLTCGVNPQTPVWGQILCLWLGAITIIFATVTDYYDGKIARQRGLVSSFGKLMDPLADKILVMSGYVLLIEISYPGTMTALAPAWAVILILAREFFVTGLRQIALEKGVVISADRLGKHKTGWQLGLLIGVAVLLAFRATISVFSCVRPFLPVYDEITLFAFYLVLVIVLVLTLLSGYFYFRNNWALIKEAK